MNKMKKIFIKPGIHMAVNFAITAILLCIYGYSVYTEGFLWSYFFVCIGLTALIGLVLNLNFKLKKSVGIVCMLIVPVIDFYLLEAFSHNAFEMNGALQVLNIVFYLALFGILFFVTGRGNVGACVTSLLAMAVGVANYYTICFRSSPILPWDLLSLKTAMSVTSNYQFSIDRQMFAVALGFVLLTAFASKIAVNIRRPLPRVVFGLSGAAVIAVIPLMLQNGSVKSFLKMDETLFMPASLYETNGFAVSFMYNLQYISVNKPEGYSLAQVEDVMNAYTAAQTSASGNSGENMEENQQLPNIIVIMNEAFSDLAVLGDFETNADYMPFTHSLTENTIRGNLFVSVKGGNTANSEFEFLTGDSMAFLPQGSVAYQQFINSETPTLVSYLESLGYQTAAMHPFNASGWDRDEVYPFFGFDRILFYNDFTHKDKLRTYVSDASSFAQLIDVYEQRDKDRPMFAFEVTMQNHGGYYNDYDNFTPEIELRGIEESKSKHYTEQYLSLIKKSDEAFESLIHYFSGQDEKTIVVMFGDHQPADLIAQPILQMNQKLDDTSLETTQDRYVVPFIIWSNDALQSAEIERLSVNYLSAYILKAAGLPLSGYHQFLYDLSKEIPVVTANVYIDAMGNYYNTKDNPYADRLAQYETLQYYHLFDKDTSFKDFYGPIPQVQP